MADYRDVDPKIGTLEDFDEMAAAFKEADIQVIVDIVPNHTSDDHVWFQEALASPKGSNARDRFIFRDGELICPMPFCDLSFQLSTRQANPPESSVPVS